MIFRELLTKWGFEFEHDKLDKAEKELEKIRSRLEFIAAAEVIKGVVELTERFAHFAEELHVAATSAGITVEAFQKLAFAAGQSAVSQEEMEQSMTRLTRNLYEARKGGAEAQKVFADAGFNQDQITRFKTGSDVMLALADKFKGIQDPIKKQALAMELMGRGSVHMVGFLSQGSGAIKGLGDEASKLGIVLSGRQVEALVDVEHAMARLMGVIKGTAAAIASYFAPSIETAIDDFIKFYEVNRKLIEVNIKEWVWNVTYAMGAVWAAVKFVTEAFIKLAQALHIDKYIGTAIFAFGAYVATLFAVSKAVGLVQGAMNLLAWSMGPVGAALKVVRGAVSLLVGGLARLVSSEAAAAAGAAILEAPLWLIGLAVAAVVIAVHDLWKILHGGSFKDTWLGGFVGWVESFEGLKPKLESIVKFFKDFSLLGKIGGMFSKATMTVGGMIDKAAGPAQGIMSGIQNVNSLQSIENITKMVPQASTNQTSVGGDQSYEINAPITINTPAGADHKMVGQKVKEGVREHLDRVYRETQRSLRPAQAY